MLGFFFYLDHHKTTVRRPPTSSDMLNAIKSSPAFSCVLQKVLFWMSISTFFLLLLFPPFHILLLTVMYLLMENTHLYF